MSDVRVYAGQPVPLSVTATDGRVDLNLQAEIINKVTLLSEGQVDLSHVLVGEYVGDAAPLSLAPGQYRAVYRNFTDPSRTILDTKREHDGDNIVILTMDVPRIGVAYDDNADVLLVEVTASRGGDPMPAAELSSAQIDVYDADDNLMISISDLAPDGLGVFRLSQPNPGLTADRLYYVKVTVTSSTAGVVTGNKGFHTTE